MDINNMISVNEARSIICNTVSPITTEKVSILDAVGRVLAKPAYSDIDVTPFDDSAMDGFGVVASDLNNASDNNPIELTCIAHIGAGSTFDSSVAPGQTVRIMTGAPVPDGVDAVVKIEDVTWDNEGSVGDTIYFTTTVNPGKNIRPKASEASAGDKIIEAGDVISPAGAGLLAACGNTEVSVYKRPRVGIISIGSELVDASEIPGRGMIRNSNVYSMQANVIAAGGIPQVYPIVTDDADAIREVYMHAVEESDAVVSTGGACLGDFDLTGDILDELGEIYFGRVNVKPGKSQPFGIINGKPVFVLSGNPAASSMGFELYTRLALRIMQGYQDLNRPTVLATITCDVKKKDPRMCLERAILSENNLGELEVVTLKKQSSALFGALQNCNCLAVIPEGLEPINKGDSVVCILTNADESIPFHSA